MLGTKVLRVLLPAMLIRLSWMRMGVLMATGRGARFCYEEARSKALGAGKQSRHQQNTTQLYAAPIHIPTFDSNTFCIPLPGI